MIRGQVAAEDVGPVPAYSASVIRAGITAVEVRDASRSWFPTIGTTRVTASGGFEFRAIPLGSYRVVVRPQAADWSTVVSDPVVVRREEPANLPPLVVAQVKEAIGGVVKDASGQPSAGVRVSHMRSD